MDCGISGESDKGSAAQRPGRVQGGRREMEKRHTAVRGHSGLENSALYLTLTVIIKMSTGKIPFLEAVNGSDVLIPCTYTSCIGIKNLFFRWEFNDNGTMVTVLDSIIPIDNADPTSLNIYRERVEFVGKTNNVSIMIWNVTFEDAGQYTCFGKNPKERGKNHSAIFTLYVVDELRVVDNTLTLIIVSAVGGCIALLMIFMLLKNFTIYVLDKIKEKNKECLVSSSGIDNTVNSLSGTRVMSKATPKKA